MILGNALSFAVLGVNSDRRGQGFTLFFENPRRQCIRGIVSFDFAASLKNDRSVVVVVVDVVNGTTADLNAPLKCGLMDVVAVHTRASEAGQERRMDVDHSVFEIWRDQDVLEKPSHHHQLDTGITTGSEHGLGIALGIGKVLLTNDSCFQTSVLGDLNTAHRWTAADHNSDVDWQFIVIAMLDQVCQ